MDSDRAIYLFRKNAPAIAYVDVEKATGDRSIGTAFHIGDGIFVTARHVLKENKIIEIRITEPVLVSTTDIFPDLPTEEITRQDEFMNSFDPPLRWKKSLPPMILETGPLFPEHPHLDVAIFKVKNIHPAVPAIDLGIHFDDFIYRKPWELSDAIIVGYPPIPFANEPKLIGSRAEIHTYTYLRGLPKIHFILSATPRGGFSGGPAIHEGDFALGVITTSLVNSGEATGLGFMAVLSVEVIHELLDQHKIMPQRQKEIRKQLLGTQENIETLNG